MKHSWKKNAVAKLLISAARTALRLQPTAEIKEKGAEKDLYTNADVEVEQLFADAMDNPADEEFFVGEETVFSYVKKHNKSLRYVFCKTAHVVDPIDGTLNYLNRLPTWAISVGLVESGEITQGAVVLPELREMLISENGAVFYCKFGCAMNDMNENTSMEFTRLQPPRIAHGDRHTLFVNSNALSAPSVDASEHHSPYHVNRSSVYSAIKVLLGNYWGYKSKAKIWDLAGCLGLFKNLGVPVFFLRDKKLVPFSYAVTEDLWVDYLTARYQIVFAHSQELARRFET